MRIAVALAVLALIVVAGAFTYWQTRAYYRVANTGPASNPTSYRVRCATVDGGPANGVDIRVPFDGGSAGSPIPMDSFTLSSSSGTCVRLSGTDVTSGKGQRVGAGCPAGQVAGWDARRANCASEGAAVDVDVTLGRQ